MSAPALEAPSRRRADPAAFLRAGADGGSRLELVVRGARCGGCISKIEKAVAALPGVGEARLNLTTGKLAVTWTPGSAADGTAVCETLDGLGYASAPFDPSRVEADEAAEGRRLVKALGVAGFGAMNAMMFTVPVWSGVGLGEGMRTFLYWAAAVVATPCALYAGRTFFASAWRSLRKGRANMDVPITIGVLTTLAISFSETLQHGRHAYFEAATALLFLLLIGRWLDWSLKAKARSAARDLLALQAQTASVVLGDGRVVSRPVGEVEPGDRVAVLPGERAPVDGRVLEGRGDIDVALVTGESLPAIAEPGVRMQAGALSLNGRLVLVALARAEDSTVAAVARLMEAGAQAKSKYVRLADKAAALYVPLVHSLAALTVLGWLIFGAGWRVALLRGVAVLIITCPCALGLAAPAVQITASGRLFRRGILVKSGAALERLAEVDTVIFDKTGVLTEGRPLLLDPASPDLRQAAVLARASRHPLARALAEAAGPGPVAEGVTEQAGHGVEGVIDGVTARLGRAEFVGAEGVSGAETELWFRLGEAAPVRFRFREQLRLDARETIDRLKARGLRIEILSGDLDAPVHAVAEALGVEIWRARLTPQQKAQRIEALAAEGRRVAMVGDGLNDAAALARAHASLAPGSAAEASQNAADLVYEGDRLGPVVEALAVARDARRRALENFALSAAYNLIAAPLAVLGLATPLVAAIAMSASSLAVMLNALRLGLPARRP